MDEESIWYIMDEVGSSIAHSDVPNLAVHPFIYAPNNKFDAHTITYSVRLYLTNNISLDMLAFT
jgi:tubulin--tyrosine ligase-like protein 12